MPPKKVTNQQWNRLHSRCNKPLSKCSRLHKTCNRSCKMKAHLIQLLSRPHRECNRVLLHLSRHLVKQAQWDNRVQKVLRANRVLNKVLNRVLNKVLLKMVPTFHSRHSLQQTMRSKVQQNVPKLVETPQRLRLLKSKSTKVRLTWNRVQNASRLV